MHLKEPKKFVDRGSNPKYGLVKGEGEEGGWERRVPVRVKDVAGLVQGAYKGRGRGNAFLNDLCDADVLIHVVDASGRTDGGGNKIDGSGGVLYDVSKVSFSSFFFCFEIIFFFPWFFLTFSEGRRVGVSRDSQVDI